MKEFSWKTHPWWYAHLHVRLAAIIKLYNTTSIINILQGRIIPESVRITEINIKSMRGDFNEIFQKVIFSVD